MLFNDHEIWAHKMGLPLSARFKHSEEEIARATREVISQHPEHTFAEARGRALARLDGLRHAQSERKSAIISRQHNWRRWAEVILFWLLVLAVILLAGKAHGQNVVVRGAAKGTSPAANVTATSTDANHTGFDVNCVAGCGAGSGAVAIADGSTPANKATVDSGNLHVNCAVGCAGGSTTPADTFATPTTAGIQMIFPALYNGTTWDRWRGDATNGAWVNIKASVALAVTGTFWQATQPISAATLPLPTGAALDSSLGTLDTDVKANIVLAAGTHVIGHVIADIGSTTAVTGNVAVTKADGSDVTFGAKADAAATQTDTTPVSAISILKEISAKAQAPASTPVTGTFWQATQPVSAATLPLPSGAATDASLTADPCGPGHAKSYAIYDASTNGSTQLVGLLSGKIVYVCSYAITSSSTTANTIKLVYGTGTACATGQTAITPGLVVQAVASSGPAGKVVPNSAGLQTIASNELCVVTNAAQAAQVEVAYVQQ